MTDRPRFHLLGMLPGESFTLTLGPEDKVHAYELVRSDRLDEEGNPVLLARDDQGALVTLGQIASANGGSYFVHPIRQESPRS